MKVNFIAIWTTRYLSSCKKGKAAPLQAWSDNGTGWW